MTALIAKRRPKRPWIPLLILLALAAGLLLWRQAAGRYGHLEVRVVDAYTLSPIEGAWVAIPGQKMAQATDSAGEAAFMGLSIRANPALKGIDAPPFGECALLSTMEGYRPTILFYAHVFEGQVRRTTIYMFPEEKDDTEIITISETPEEAWLKLFVERYGGPD